TIVASYTEAYVHSPVAFREDVLRTDSDDGAAKEEYNKPNKFFPDHSVKFFIMSAYSYSFSASAPICLFRAKVNNSPCCSMGACVHRVKKTVHSVKEIGSLPLWCAIDQLISDQYRCICCMR